MIDCEDIEDDFFTPVASTSLANLFGSKDVIHSESDNCSLKYVPHKEADSDLKSDYSKQSECIFACSLIGFQWFNQAYSSKGPLGFAILKSFQTGIHNMFLYTTNKQTLSCTTVSQLLEVTVKERQYISYYDDVKNYWSLYSSEQEISKIIEILSSMGVLIKRSKNEDLQVPLLNDLEQKPHLSDKYHKDSVTDSSDISNPKASILSRMASMGQCILPPNTKIGDDISDSSDTSNKTIQTRTRHKVVKQNIKKNNDKITLSHKTNESSDNFSKSMVSKVDYIPENMNIIHFANRQILPPSSYSNNNLCQNDLKLLMSEQRISNSEIRINLNRMFDKVNLILDQVKTINSLQNDESNHFQTAIMQKLISQYENKIKIYEELLEVKGVNHNVLIDTETKPIHNIKNHPSDNQHMSKDKDLEICMLKKEIDNLKHKAEEIANRDETTIENLKEKIILLEQKISPGKSHIAPQLQNEQSIDLNSKLKNIMNDTYQEMCNHFEDETNYSGRNIKNCLRLVIKNHTMNILFNKK